MEFHKPVAVWVRGEIRQANNCADIYNCELISQVAQLDCNKAIFVRKTSMVDNTHIFMSREGTGQHPAGWSLRFSIEAEAWLGDHPRVPHMSVHQQSVSRHHYSDSCGFRIVKIPWMGPCLYRKVNISFLEFKYRDFKLRHEFNQEHVPDRTIFWESLRMGKLESAIVYQLSTNVVHGFIAFSPEIKYMADIFITPFENPTI